MAQGQGTGGAATAAAKFSQQAGGNVACKQLITTGEQLTVRFSRKQGRLPGKDGTLRSKGSGEAQVVTTRPCSKIQSLVCASPLSRCPP